MESWRPARPEAAASAGATPDSWLRLGAVRHDSGGGRGTRRAPGWTAGRDHGPDPPVDDHQRVTLARGGAVVIKDANTRLQNMPPGELNLIGALDRNLDFTSEEGKPNEPAAQTCPPSWSGRAVDLDEKQRRWTVSGVRSCSTLAPHFFDRDAASGEGIRPLLRPAQIQSHLQAGPEPRPNLAQDSLGIPRGTFRAWC